MAKPREITRDPPPAESEEDEESEEVETESEQEDAGNGKNNNSSLTPPPSAAKKPESRTSNVQTTVSGTASEDDDEDEDEDYGSESGSDEDSPPRKSDFSVKPIASKPMIEPEKTITPAVKKAASKPNASGLTSPTRNPTAGVGVKRAASETASPAGNADSKRAKKKTDDNSAKKVAGTPNNDDEKKLFARVFSEDDEIVLLKGIFDFTAKTKSDPFTKINEFHDFITEKIGGDKSKAQVLHKMKRLKKRYDNHAERILKSGKEKISSNPHERNMYDLSKKIWGNEDNAGKEEISDGALKGNKKIAEANGSEARKSQSELKIEKSLANVKKEKSFSFAPDFGGFNADWFLHEGTELMDEDDRIEMESKWKAFRLEEAELLIKKHNLILEHMGKVHKGLK